MIKHILFPTDTSRMSVAGFPLAVNLARRYGARITVLNVHQEFMSKEEMLTLRVSPSHFEEIMREKALASRVEIDKMIAAEEAGDLCTVILREGHPRKKIIEVAAELEADMIVMTSNGRSNLSEEILGSTAEYVIRHSPIPVLVVKVRK